MQEGRRAPLYFGVNIICKCPSGSGSSPVLHTGYSSHILLARPPCKEGSVGTVPEEHRWVQVMRQEERLLRLSSVYSSSAGGHTESGNHVDSVSWGRLGPQRATCSY